MQELSAKGVGSLTPRMCDIKSTAVADHSVPLWVSRECPLLSEKLFHFAQEVRKKDDEPWLLSIIALTLARDCSLPSY